MKQIHLNINELNEVIMGAVRQALNEDINVDSNGEWYDDEMPEESGAHDDFEDGVYQHEMGKHNSEEVAGFEDNEFENDEPDGFNSEYEIEDVCEAFGEGPVTIEGTLGLWDGKHTIQPVDMPDIESAIYKCIGRDGELMSEDDIFYDSEKDLVVMNVHHHNGINVFQITRSNGEDLYEVRKRIEQLVRESINQLDMSGMVPSGEFDQQEVKRSSIAKAKQRKEKKSHESDVHQHNKMVKSHKDKKDDKKKGKVSKGKRSIVLHWLKKPSVNCAEIMRQLWNPDKSEEDAARSYFYKCRDGVLNDSGVPYKFSDADINSLYKIKSSSM